MLGMTRLKSFRACGGFAILAILGRIWFLDYHSRFVWVFLGWSVSGDDGDIFDLRVRECDKEIDINP